MTPTEAPADRGRTLCEKYLEADPKNARAFLRELAAAHAEDLAAAVAAERERAAKIADAATTGLTGFVESDRMGFAVKNMAKLRAVIAAAIRAG